MIDSFDLIKEFVQERGFTVYDTYRSIYGWWEIYISTEIRYMSIIISSGSTPTAPNEIFIYGGSIRKIMDLREPDSLKDLDKMIRDLIFYHDQTEIIDASR